jgi:hypothetical protein
LLTFSHHAYLQNFSGIFLGFLVCQLPAKDGHHSVQPAPQTIFNGFGVQYAIPRCPAILVSHFVTTFLKIYT